MTPEREFQFGFTLILISAFVVFGTLLISSTPMFFNSKLFLSGLSIGLMIFSLGAFYSVKTKDKKYCKHSGKIIMGFTEWTNDPSIFKTSIMCPNCDHTGYIETNTIKNTQNIIWDEKK